MTGKTIFISDIHMGINARTNWYQDRVHRKALKGFLRYILKHATGINEVVILGDWFDQWTYSPTGNPPDVTQIMEDNKDIFISQEDGSGDFISVMEAIRGNLRFINGNHDMLVELKDINGWLAQHTDQRVYPGVGGDLAKPSSENTFYQNDNGKIYAEHGHLYDLFNKPANMPQNQYAPVPVGHFITRTVGDYVLKQLDSAHPNSACLKGSGDPNYSNFGIDLKVICETIIDLIKRGEEPNISEITLDIVLSFDKTGKLNYNMQWHCGGCPSSDAVDNYYPGLFSPGNLFEDLREAGVSFEGLDCFAKQHFNKNPRVRVMVMGHTHDYKLVWSGREKDPVYMNSGFYCASIPDMESGKKMLTFVEVIETDNAGFTINEKKIADYKTGVVIQGQSATID